MTDIVERLRTMATWGPDMQRTSTMNEAADEIERLREDTNVVHADICAENDNMRAEIERLRAALKELADASEHDLKMNQGSDKEDEPDSGGWWSLRTENAIRAARAFEQDAQQ